MTGELLTSMRAVFGRDAVDGGGMKTYRVTLRREAVEFVRASSGRVAVSAAWDLEHDWVDGDTSVEEVAVAETVVWNADANEWEPA